LTRKRVLKLPDAAWVAAVVGAWLAAASCRTMHGGAAAPTPAGKAPFADAAPSVPLPSIRVGVLVAVERAAVGAGRGVVVHGRAAGEVASRVRTLPRATFVPGAPAGRVRLAETGDELEEALVAPAGSGESLEVDGAAYRGLVEVRPAEAARLTVVNVVNLEDYLRGVVPNELAPAAFPQIEALKAQAVAARSYALAHLGDYASKGYDVCATAACQVYRGVASEHPLTDRAVAQTARTIATWRGRPINAYYTATCGGHTEEGEAIFEDGAPYLRGVACEPESSARHSIRTSASPRRGLPGGDETARSLALLEALGVVEASEADPHRLAGRPTGAEARAWTARLQRLLPEAGEGPDTLRALEVAAPYAFGLGQESPPSTRREALGRLAGWAERAGLTGLAVGEVAGVEDGQLSVLHGETAASHPVDPSVRLFRDRGGVHAAVTALSLAVGDRVLYVERGGRVLYLEGEHTPGSTGVDRASPHYHWQTRLTPLDVARSIGRYGEVGRVRDLVPTRLGVSGRVVELKVVGTEGELDLRGLRVRLGLGLRENLFVIEREKGLRGEVQRFVITGKGWGHGVGLCQVGAFGMAQGGATFEEILRHYYTGVTLARPAPAGPVPAPRLASAVFDTRRSGS
jgi:stage II sporulation protein D